MVDDLNVPLKDATQGFTRMAAAGNSAGLSFEEIKDTFEGLATANKALGGDTEKLNGILLATTQVFSKGKVTAEELRGQIGERLPGAVSKFAEATGRTTAELDTALQKGEVTIKEFVDFARKLFADYEKDAKKIADSPADAGARLKTVLTDLQNNIGAILQPIGAAFQREFASIASIINDATIALRDFLGVGTQGAIAKTQAELTAAFATYDKLIAIERRNQQNGLPVDMTYVDSAASRIAALQDRLRELKAFSQPPTQATDPLKPLTGDDPDKDKLKTGEELERILQREIQLLQAKGDLERELLQIQFAEEDRARKILEVEQDRRANLTALSEQLAASQAGDAIGKALGSDLADVLTEVEELKEGFKGLGQDLAEMLKNQPLKAYMTQLKEEFENTEAIAVRMAQTVERSWALQCRRPSSGLSTEQRAFKKPSPTCSRTSARRSSPWQRK